METKFTWNFALIPVYRNSQENILILHCITELTLYYAFTFATNLILCTHPFHTVLLLQLPDDITIGKLFYSCLCLQTILQGNERHGGGFECMKSVLLRIEPMMHTMQLYNIEGFKQNRTKKTIQNSKSVSDWKSVQREE